MRPHVYPRESCCPMRTPDSRTRRSAARSACSTRLRSHGPGRIWLGDERYGDGPGCQELLQERPGKRGRTRLGRHCEPLTENDLALDIDARIVIQRPGPDLNEIASHSLRSGVGTERVAIGRKLERVVPSYVECGAQRIADQGFALEALDLEPEVLKLMLNVVAGTRFFR